MILTIEVLTKSRLDVYISEHSDITRSYAAKLIERGLCSVNGVLSVKSGEKLKTGDKIELQIPENIETIEKKDIPFDIIYEDNDIAIINKPQGLTVHPAAGNFDNTLVNGLMYRLDSLSGINGVIRPGIVHRLDKNTSGIMVVAKNDKAHLSLSEQIAARSVIKQYVAIVEGNFKDDAGTVITGIARNPKDRKQMCVSPFGREAITGYRVVQRFSDNCFVLFDLHTGRTHQIRVHCKHLGHPIVGDPVYGFKKQKFRLDGQLLHSYRLTLKHPSTGQTMTFTAKLPDYFVEVYNNLAKQNNIEPFMENIVDKFL